MLVSSTGSPVGPFGFAGSSGYQTDASGLQLLGHRYYDSSTGRFLTKDPVGHGRNWYDYCANNPTRSVDPSGDVSNEIAIRLFVLQSSLIQWYNCAHAVHNIPPNPTGRPVITKPLEVPDEPDPAGLEGPTRSEEVEESLRDKELADEMAEAAEGGAKAAATVEEVEVAEVTLETVVVIVDL